MTKQEYIERLCRMSLASRRIGGAAMTVDEIEDKLDTLQTGGLIGQTRAFMIGMNECRNASIESRRLADSGGSFYTITLDRLPIEVAAEIIATFMNCRSA